MHEAAVDFSLVGEQSEALVEVSGARLVAQDGKPQPLSRGASERVLALGLVVNSRITSITPWGRNRDVLAASEALLRDGDAVEIVGYKSRAVDAAVSARLPRDVPFRPTLRAGRALPLLVAVAPRPRERRRREPSSS